MTKIIFEIADNYENRNIINYKEGKKYNLSFHV